MTYQNVCSCCTMMALKSGAGILPSSAFWLGRVKAMVTAVLGERLVCVTPQCGLPGAIGRTCDVELDSDTSVHTPNSVSLDVTLLIVTTVYFY